MTKGRLLLTLRRSSSSFPEEVVDQAQKQIPPEWLEGDESALERLLMRLMERRKRVPDLIRDSQHGRINPFPAWK